jgi:branched-chain amino acid transport system substrate-binding protein
MVGKKISRRQALKAAGVLAGAGAAAKIGGIGSLPSTLRHVAYAAPQSAAPLRVGFQVHRTGIGAVYGRWWERTAAAAAGYINEKGGIAGRPLQLVAQDDGTDPARGAIAVEKLASDDKVDLIFGTLFSNVVIASAPRAGELKIPYLVVSEGYHVASGKMNRYCFQPGITDVRAQLTAISSWIVGNLGKKITMIYPDYAFGYDHRDFFGKAAARLGATVQAQIAIPPTETSFTKYFPRIPADTEVLYHVMVGPGVLTFVKELGEHFGSKRPQLFGFIDSLEGVDLASPGLEFLEGTHFWEAFPRYTGGYNTSFERTYRARVGVNASGASVKDSKDVSTYSHMFGVWETLFVIKQTIEQSGYRRAGPKDYKAFIETLERFQGFSEGITHPQGPKKFVGQVHQAFGQQFISRVEGRKLKVVHRTKIDDSLYPPEADYTKQPL